MKKKINAEAEDTLRELINQRDTLNQQIQTLLVGVRMGMGLDAHFRFNPNELTFEKPDKEKDEEKKTK